ncbi:MAG TPA: hypothetical protein H9715_08065, partial [Candidatus Merdibacter merdigallinarum]|nr:hypothetical protein [Candidatus Merdibacter merdigallinarum]
LSAITDGSSPVISYNYGARRAHKVKKACITMALLAVAYTLAIWLVILLAPRVLIAVFSSDEALLADTIPAMKLYFSTFRISGRPTGTAWFGWENERHTPARPLAGGVCRFCWKARTT